MTVFHFIILSLAVYRMTVLIVRDVGPWRIFSKLRCVARWSKLLTCVFCTSIWVSGLVNALYYFACETSPLIVVAMSVFAMSGIAIILDKTWTADYAPK